MTDDEAVIMIQSMIAEAADLEQYPMRISRDTKPFPHIKKRLEVFVGFDKHPNVFNCSPLLKGLTPVKEITYTSGGAYGLIIEGSIEGRPIDLTIYFEAMDIRGHRPRLINHDS